MIKTIKFKFGTHETQPSLSMDVTPITVFVGPNNSGKSKVLVEIENYCRRARPQGNDVILGKLEFVPFSLTEIESEITKLEQVPKANETLNPGHIILGKLNPQNNQLFRAQVNKEALIKEAQNPQNGHNQYATFLNIYTVRMDGTNRLNLLQEQNAGDLQTTSANHLTHLFIDNDLRKEVRRIIFDAFHKYFVIDPTKIGKLRVRLSDREPIDEREEKGWEQRSIDFHKQAIEISQASDGVKAFTGIVTTILAGDPKIALIDEPEAFLHPALSNKLGKEVAKALQGSKKE